MWIDFRSYADWLPICHQRHLVKNGDEDQRLEQITLDLFHNCDVPEKVSTTFDPEIDFK